MDWQKYQENVDKFFENVDNDIMESERLLNKMPSNFLFFLSFKTSSGIF